MAREIKFRAWNKTTNKMHYDLLIDPKGANSLNGWFNSVAAGLHYEFMQWTGLLDKNGVEIYEGDYYRMPGKYGGEGYEGVISWIDNMAGFALVRHEDEPVMVFDNKGEVLGNKYEGK